MGRHRKRIYMQPELIPGVTPAIRLWLYGILTCAIPLLIAYGIVDQATAPLWVALGGAVLGLGTAYIHTPTRQNDDERQADADTDSTTNR